MPTRTALITSGTTAATSSTFTVDAGAPASVFITSANPTPLMAAILEMYDGTSYFTIEEIRFPGRQVTAPGTYRVRRDKVAVAFAVDLVK